MDALGLKIALLVIGDGRESYLHRTIAEARRSLPMKSLSPCVMVNDSGDAAYGEHLRYAYPGFNVVSHAERRGLAGAVQSGWRKVLESEADFTFHLEEDFLLKGRLPLREMAAAFSIDPRLCQVVLRRQPWNDEEIAQGDIFGSDPRYIQRDAWVEHDVIFSLNPMLVPRVVMEMGWPDGNEAEMTDRVRAHGMKMAWWGHKGDEPDVEHIGVTRGTGWKV